VYSQPGGLLERYREMAADTERENEAQLWINPILGRRGLPPEN
jgi:hypothetical protein